MLLLLYTLTLTPPHTYANTYLPPHQPTPTRTRTVIPFSLHISEPVVSPAGGGGGSGRRRRGGGEAAAGGAPGGHGSPQGVEQGAGPP